MNAIPSDELRQIKTFPSLVKYLRDELDWPIESENFEDLTFEYEPDELGLDAKAAAKVKEIKQLRPLSSAQPWGIFFVNFEPKRLPVVVLRRILSHLVVKKRQSANKSDRPAWQLHDLLFISSYGESEHRDISFAHFSEGSADSSDLPVLRVLGWDDEDSVLHLAHAHATLTEKLRWPESPGNAAAWRKDWSSAFVLKHGYVAKTSKELSVQMAGLATRIRKRVNKALAVESDSGPLKSLMAGFKAALIHDLESDDFADMYAQTVTYGLLSARVSRPAGLIAENIVDMVPDTNPFLKELLTTFLKVGGRKGKIDFDELGLNEVVQALRDAEMPAILRDFNDRNPQEDPVIHFYELFLKEYDAKKRMQRGVFYTPKPVVSYIVRSVHELLQTEFGLPDGLADTTTWGEMLKKFPASPGTQGEGRGEGLRLPEIEVVNPKTHKLEKKPIDPVTPFVQILDPATGTATFLVEVIDVIHKTMLAKWKKQGHTEMFDIPKLWNEYVPKHLLPRLYGYELMMAPYAIAHMKIGLKLFETGYKFGSGERARIYLTNALEPPQDFSNIFEQMAPALAHEAKAVNKVKLHQRFTVVIGNPPYSNFGQLNRTPFIIDLLDEYKRGLEETKINLDDDFIKFVRYSQHQTNNAGIGVLGMITNNAYADGITHRRMRRSLSETFDALHILDLHGSSKRRERCPDGSEDECVFDITIGVGILLAARRLQNRDGGVQLRHADLWGRRDSKYHRLATTSLLKTDWLSLVPSAPYYFFVPKSLTETTEYGGWPSILEVFPVFSSGIQTKRDHIAVAPTENALLATLKAFATKSERELRSEYSLPEDGRDWRIEWASQHAKRILKSPDSLRRILYRPFDTRWTVIDDKSKGFVAYPRFEVMSQMKSGNVGLIVTRQLSLPTFQHVLVTRDVIDGNTISLQTREYNYLFPLHLPEPVGSTGDLLDSSPRANVSPAVTKRFFDARHLELFQYIYAIFHSSSYRQRYREFLRIEFPRVPVPASMSLFSALAEKGSLLTSLHLLESPKLGVTVSERVGIAEPTVEKVTYTNGTVWLDKKQTCGFAGVPEAVWNFHIGGYQVCEKWLKDRKGRTLSKDDLTHYQKIVVALNETIRLMKEIDEVIEKHGGWPGAFVTGQKEGPAT